MRTQQARHPEAGKGRGAELRHPRKSRMSGAFLTFVDRSARDPRARQSFFRRILSDIVEFGRLCLPASSRSPGQGGNILTAFLAGSRNRTDRRMKQLGAAVALLVLC